MQLKVGAGGSRAAKVAAAAIGGAGLLAASQGQAWAADSGLVYEFTILYHNGNWTNACQQTNHGLAAQDVADGWARTYSWNGNVNQPGCNSPDVVVPAQYLFANVELYRDGFLCDWDNVLNGVPGSILTTGTECFDPPLAQNYQSRSNGAWFKGQFCGAGECFNGYKFADHQVASPNSFF